MTSVSPASDLDVIAGLLFGTSRSQNLGGGAGAFAALFALRVQTLGLKQMKR
jgi:hypothetical protein